MVKFKKGSNNIADPLSRLATNLEVTNDLSEENEEYIMSMVEANAEKLMA